MAHLTQYIVRLTAENRGEHNGLLSAIQAGAFICTDGSATIRVNDVGRKLSAGDMLLYPPYSKVSLEDSDDDFKGLSCFGRLRVCDCFCQAFGVECQPAFYFETPCSEIIGESEGLKRIKTADE